MATEKEIPKKEKESKKGSRLSLKIIFLLVLLLAIVLTGFYFYYKNTQGKKAQYDANLQQIEKLQSEKKRCSNVLSQESGKFGDYEYCRQLLQIFPKITLDGKK
ncbi:MAG TPA: hypothetical protein VFD45_02705 [Patescibacteria group bacterium]|nr:hypothetical protein [Patescibacteria group bacterium]